MRHGSEITLEIFAKTGPAVAILTNAMRRTSELFALCLLIAMTANAQNWSVGGGTGAFVFGDFAKRTDILGNETGSTKSTTTLSAATRPGVAADIERDFGRWLGVRLGASWTYAPLRASGVNLDAGHIAVTTFVLPVVVNLNRGDFRVHVMAGPAYALYHVNSRAGGGADFPLFSGTRGRSGGMAGGGVTWWWSRRFGVEGEVSYIKTSSPFRVEDLATSAKNLEILRPTNIHTTVGIRYRF
jgi:hypothetical protein